MIVGTCSIECYIREANSLKDKRRILQSLLTSIRKKFNLSAIELADSMDSWRTMNLAIVGVNNSRRALNSILSKVVEFTSSNPAIDVLNYQIEFR